VLGVTSLLTEPPVRQSKAVKPARLPKGKDAGEAVLKGCHAEVRGEKEHGEVVQ